MQNFLDVIPIWAVFPLTVLVTWLAAALGYRVGKWRQSRNPSAKDPSIGAMVGASLALLAFLLAFVTGIAESRFDNRRRLVLTEANAIGTAELRARYLPEPQASESRALFREYVDGRLSVTVENFAQVRARAEEIQSELWSRAQALAREIPDSEVLSLYIDALNSVIDIHGERVAAVSARVPPTLIVLLYTLSILSMFLVGFSNSYDGRRGGIAMFVFILIFAAVITIIVDLDHPREGLLQVSQQPMIDLQKSLNP
jgi:hypothetical protein